jgi:hypothetical protein
MRQGVAVFVDGEAWIALALTRDPLHAQARERWEILQGTGAKLHYVLGPQRCAASGVGETPFINPAPRYAADPANRREVGCFELVRQDDVAQAEARFAVLRWVGQGDVACACSRRISRNVH